MTDFETDRPISDRIAEALAGAYTIECEIGRGGMGIVYRARDEQLQRTVAIKILPPELAFQGEIRERFVREARTAAKLSHPHIVPIYTVGESGGLVYFSMGYVDGESVAARIRRRGSLPVDEARRIMKETADALSAAHALSVIHRDIKPDNILLEGARSRVMVTDFGIAKALSSTSGAMATLTAAGIAIGTPSYMSPEQAAGDHEIDGRSDVYSLGIVTYQMLTEHLPFTSPTVAGMLIKHVTEPAPDVRQARPDVPEDLAVAVARCLEKSPDHRWPTADALRRALESGKVAPYRPSGVRQSTVPSTHVSPEKKKKKDEYYFHRRAKRKAEVIGRREARQAAARQEPSEQVHPVDTGEPKIVQQVRGKFAKWGAVSLGCLGINLATGIDTPWFLFPMFGMSFGMLKSYAVLWQLGYSWRDVLSRPPAPDAIETGRGKGGRLPRQPALPSAEEFGEHLPAVWQVHGDREAILKLIEKLPPADHKVLPDIHETVDALYRRAADLARTLQTMDSTLEERSLGHIDERLAAVMKEPEDTERERRLDLLRRQRQTLLELRSRQTTIAGYLESCVLGMQNVRFDLLRLRSAGINAVLGDLTQATQQAKALSRDVDYAIAAAGEIRDVLRS